MSADGFTLGRIMVTDTCAVLSSGESFSSNDGENGFPEELKTIEARIKPTDTAVMIKKRNRGILRFYLRINTSSTSVSESRVRVNCTFSLLDELGLGIARCTP